MDLRLYTKSGNEYYVDISEYDVEHIRECLTDAVDRGDILTLESKGNTFVIKCRELELFEIILDSEEVKEVKKACKIGFNIGEED